MKKRIASVLCLLMALLVSAFFFAGCKHDPEPEPEPEPEQQEETSDKKGNVYFTAGDANVVEENEPNEKQAGQTIRY